jgi:hypothetical protein
LLDALFPASLAKTGRRIDKTRRPVITITDFEKTCKFNKLGVSCCSMCPVAARALGFRRRAGQKD